MCSGRILTLIKITTHVPPPGGIISLPAAQLTYKPNMGPKRKLRASPRATSGQTLLTRIHYLARAMQLSGASNNQYKDPFRSNPRLWHEDPPKPATHALLTVMLDSSYNNQYKDSSISAICGSSYATRSSPRSKHYNALIPMRVVMDSIGYLCMAIQTIKRHDPGSYEKFITCKSCSYVDLKYPTYINR